jgi:hypothetical protein
VGLGLSGCTKPAQSASSQKATHVKVEAVAGSTVKKVTLTEQANTRLGIKTSTITAAGTSTVVPYSAVLYDPSGGTWVFTVPQALTYVREKVVVATVGGAGGTEARLTTSPAAGTTIVTTGVIELYGAELGVGK